MAEDSLLLEGDPIADRLDRAVDNLEEALEAVDLGRDRAVAEEILDALAATDRARKLERR